LSAAFLNAVGVRDMVDDDHVYFGINVPWPSLNATLLYGDKFFGYIKGYIQFAEFNSERSANYYKALNEVNHKLGVNVTEFDVDSNDIFYFYDCVKAMAYGMDSVRRLNTCGVVGDPFTLDENGDINMSYTGDYYNSVTFAELEAGGERFAKYNMSAPIFFNGGAIFAFRVHSSIRSSSPPEMLVLCGGCCLIFASLIGFMGTPDAYLCTLRSSGIFVGFILFATPLISKTWKMWAIVTATHRMTDAEAQQIVFKSRVAGAVIIATAV
ncbi:hypothetical protein HDU81_000624, partial [Chytriomyces hyalinus]